MDKMAIENVVLTKEEAETLADYAEDKEYTFPLNHISCEFSAEEADWLEGFYQACSDEMTGGSMSELTHLIAEALPGYNKRRMRKYPLMDYINFIKPDREMGKANRPHLMLFVFLCDGANYSLEDVLEHIEMMYIGSRMKKVSGINMKIIQTILREKTCLTANEIYEKVIERYGDTELRKEGGQKYSKSMCNHLVPKFLFHGTKEYKNRKCICYGINGAQKEMQKQGIILGTPIKRKRAASITGA